MPVCQHCGEVGAEGALFCGNCGYTLPQAGVEPVPGGPPRAAPAAATPGPPPLVRSAPVAVVPPQSTGAYVPAGAYAAPVAAAVGAVGPIPPPPNAKYCSRCGTLIAAAAVYCPVCQQPQP